MSTNTKYHHVIRKLIVGFGSIFDNISLSRYNIQGDEEQTIKVPLIYSPKEKYVSRLIGDPDLNKKVQITLPRMSYDLVNMYYDSSRKLVSAGRKVAASDNGLEAYHQYNPVPYNFDFELYLYVRNIEDGDQLIEYILPFFTPTYTIKLNLVPTMGEIKEVPITLNSVDMNVEYEGERDSDTRLVIWTLKFTVKSYLYGTVNKKSIAKQSVISVKNLKVTNPSDKVTFITDFISGVPKFVVGEYVFQGYSLLLSTAKAEVVSYANTPAGGLLTLKNVQGDFKTNTFIYGSQSGVERTLKGTYNTNANSSTIGIEVKITPNTALANSNYTVSVIEKEYPFP